MRIETTPRRLDFTVGFDEVAMGQALDVHRLHFAFTVTFHYIFPQLTMGLALLLVYLKTQALQSRCAFLGPHLRN